MSTQIQYPYQTQKISILFRHGKGRKEGFGYVCVHLTYSTVSDDSLSIDLVDCCQVYHMPLLHDCNYGVLIRKRPPNPIATLSTTQTPHPHPAFPSSYIPYRLQSPGGGGAPDPKNAPTDGTSSLTRTSPSPSTSTFASAFTVSGGAESGERSRSKGIQKHDNLPSGGR
jgi:hypothetical protein